MLSVFFSGKYINELRAIMRLHELLSSPILLANFIPGHLFAYIRFFLGNTSFSLGKMLSQVRNRKPPTSLHRWLQE